MEKNRKKSLKRIVKKIKNEAAKNALSDLEVRAIVPVVDNKTAVAKIKTKAKKTKKLKGGLLDGKKEEVGKEGQKQAPDVSRTNGKVGENGEKGRGKGRSIWPWEW